MTIQQSQPSIDVKTLVDDIKEILTYERKYFPPGFYPKSKPEFKYANLPIDVYFELPEQSTLNLEEIKTYLDSRDISNKSKEDSVIIQFQNAPFSVTIQKDPKDSTSYLANFYTIGSSYFIIPRLLGELEKLLQDEPIIFSKTENIVRGIFHNQPME
jgi:hypothetical protein